MRHTRIATLLGCAALALGGLAACGGGDDEGGDTASPPATTQPQTTEPSGDGGGGGDDAAAGKELFASGAQPACSSCHTLADAESDGSIGPNLDELKPSAQQVVAAMETGPGLMPTYDSLSDAQRQELADYVAGAAGS
jgi:hypothetical protein